MDSATEATQTGSHKLFALKRWFSLIGLIPLGAYVVLHLLNQAKSWSGAEAYDASMAAGRGSWVNWLGTALLLGFIAYHAVVGIMLMLKSSPVSPKPTRLLHWQYILQRISAVGILLFIPAHVWKARIAPALAGTHESFAGMHEAFAVADERILTLPVYLLGTLGVAYHLANGLWTAGVTLGITQGAQAQKRMRAISISFFLFLALLAYGSIFALIRG